MTEWVFKPSREKKADVCPELLSPLCLAASFPVRHNRPSWLSLKSPVSSLCVLAELPYVTDVRAEWVSVKASSLLIRSPSTPRKGGIFRLVFTSLLFLLSRFDFPLCLSLTSSVFLSLSHPSCPSSFYEFSNFFISLFLLFFLHFELCFHILLQSPIGCHLISDELLSVHVSLFLLACLPTYLSSCLFSTSLCSSCSERRRACASVAFFSQPLLRACLLSCSHFLRSPFLWFMSPTCLCLF